MNNDYGLINLWLEGDGVTRFVALLFWPRLEGIWAERQCAPILQNPTMRTCP